MLASTFRWVRTTPFGSAVAPDVKMTSATSSCATVTGTKAPGSFHSISLSLQTTDGAGPLFSGVTSSPTSSNFASTMRATEVRKASDAR
jgi:hypothetical protein